MKARAHQSHARRQALCGRPAPARTTIGTLYNMVGFQTKLKHGEQVRIFRPFWPAPPSCTASGSTATPSSTARGSSTRSSECGAAAAALAGQITGVEVMSSAATGLIAGRLAAAQAWAAVPCAARHHGAWRADQPYHRWSYCNDRWCKPLVVPADECQFRLVPPVTLPATAPASGCAEGPGGAQAGLYRRASAHSAGGQKRSAHEALSSRNWRKTRGTAAPLVSTAAPIRASFSTGVGQARRQKGRSAATDLGLGSTASPRRLSAR